MVWESALGKCFPIRNIEASGLIEIEVSHTAASHDDGDVVHIIECIYLDADEFELIENPA